MDKKRLLENMGDIQNSLVNTLLSMMNIEKIELAWGKWAEISSTIQRQVIGLGQIIDALKKELSCTPECKDKDCNHEAWE